MRTKSIFFAAVMTAASLAFLASGWATENVRNTRHNLITNANIGATGTTEICVFCHTPHGGATDVGGTGVSAGQAPIWNRSIPTANYTTYNSPNFDANDGNAAGQPKGVSLACLSCHDGTVALDSLINFPGSGSVNGIGFTPGNNPPQNGTVDPATRKMINRDTAFEFPMLGTNLSNDHPISMKIPLDTIDPQFKGVRASLSAGQNAGRLAAGKVAFLWRQNDGSGVIETDLPSDPRDRIRAYPTMGDGEAYIECASCHNPHEGTSSRFLRYPTATQADRTAAGLDTPDAEADRNKGSLVCLTCHQK